jgi:hypothetical protein
MMTAVDRVTAGHDGHRDAGAGPGRIRVTTGGQGHVTRLEPWHDPSDRRPVTVIRVGHEKKTVSASD